MFKVKNLQSERCSDHRAPYVFKCVLLSQWTGEDGWGRVRTGEDTTRRSQRTPHTPVIPLCSASPAAALSHESSRRRCRTEHREALCHTWQVTNNRKSWTDPQRPWRPGRTDGELSFKPTIPPVPVLLPWPTAHRVRFSGRRRLIELGRILQSALCVNMWVLSDWWWTRCRSILVSMNGAKFIIHVILLAERNTPSPGRDHLSCRQLTAQVLLLIVSGHRPVTKQSQVQTFWSF